MKKSRWILVVDDDDDIREVAVVLLRMHGYEADGAADGLDALERIKAHGPPGLILLDLRMPRVHGCQLAEILREKEDLASIPIVVLSGDATAPERAAALGAQGYLKKPFDLAQLIDAVSRAMPPD